MHLILQVTFTLLIQETIPFKYLPLILDELNSDLTHKGNFLIGIGNYKLTTMYFDKALAINPKNIAAITGKKQALAALNQAK